MKKRADASSPSSSTAPGHLPPADARAAALYRPELSDTSSLAGANWRVTEIDGEAEPVYVAPTPSSAAHLADSPEPLIEDVEDATITAGLEQRRLTVSVDETATFRLALLNNGDSFACFEVSVEGWLQREWIRITRVNSLDEGTDTAQLWLQPGERILLHVAITPPRSSSSRAGSHAFAVVIRLAQSPQHKARLGAVLTIKPFTSLQLGAVHPQRLSTSWAKRSAVLRVPVTNQGNTAAEIYVQGQTAMSRGGGFRGEACHFTFYKPGGKQPHARRIMLTLPAGKTAHIVTQVMPARAVWLALHKRTTPFQLAVGLANAENAPLLVHANLTCNPLIGPWHLLTLLGIVLLSGMSMVLVAAAAAILALGQVEAPALTSAPRPETGTPWVPTTPPVIAVIVQLAQPASQTAPTQTPHIERPAPVVDAVPPAPPQPDPALPVVRLDQVSAPGGPTSQTGPLLPPPTFAKRQSITATMTYQQMFQEVATRYDLNWRMLAAQAYIESSFDTVALSGSGAMGLMQIMPGTWREWSPIVNVNDPFDAYSNALVAAAYLDFLRSSLSERGQPQMEWMLVAYHWGIDKLTEHLDAGLSWDALPAESRQYALDVLRMAETIPAN